MNSLKKITYNSPVILTFTIILFAALILNYITGGWTNRMLFSVYRSSMTSPLYFIRLIGHVFGHGGWEHFSGNMITLLLIGPLLEEKYGSLNIGILMLVTAVVTGIVNILFFPGTALLGASGIVFALIMLTSLSSMRGEGIPLTFLICLLYTSPSPRDQRGSRMPSSAWKKKNNTRPHRLSFPPLPAHSCDDPH